MEVYYMFYNILIMSESTNKYFIFGDWIWSHYKYKISTKKCKPNIVQDFSKSAVYTKMFAALKVKWNLKWKQSSIYVLFIINSKNCYE